MPKKKIKVTKTDYSGKVVILREGGGEDYCIVIMFNNKKGTCNIKLKLSLENYATASTGMVSSGKAVVKIKE